MAETRGLQEDEILLELEDIHMHFGKVAPHAYVMETGRIVMDDRSEKLSQNEDIKDFYLGLTDKGGRKSFRDVKHYKRRKRWLA